MRFGLILTLLLLVAAPAAAQDPARVQVDVREGQRLMAAGRPAAAEPLFSRAAADARNLWGNDSLDAASLTLLQANAIEDQGRLVEAEGLYRQALAALERGTEPGHPRRGWALNDLGLNLHKQGRHAEARDVMIQAVDLRRATEGPEAPPTLVSLSNLASILRRLGRFEESAGLQYAVLAVRERTLPAGDADVALTQNNLGAVLLDLDRTQEAETLLRRAVAGREVALGPDHPLTAQSLILLAEALVRDGRPLAAWAMQDRALAALEQADAPLELAAALGSRVDLALELGRLDVAASAAERALDVRRRSLPPDHPDLASSLILLGDVRLVAGRPQDAATLLNEAVESLDATFGPDHIDALRALSLLGIAEGELGRTDAAVARLGQAAALADRTLPPGHLGRSASRADHGAALAAARRPLDALPLLRLSGAELIARGGSRPSDPASRRERDSLRHLWRLTVTAAWDAAHND